MVMKPPVVPGKEGARRPAEDVVSASDPCAACGADNKDHNGARVLERHGNMRMMLCRDFKSCNKRSGVHGRALQIGRRG